MSNHLPFVADFQRSLAEAELLQLLEAEAYHEARAHFHKFVRAAWPVIEPGRTLSWNWHLDAICEHLEAVVKMQIKQLAVCVPPRTMKSTLVGACLHPWVWIQDPVSFLSGPQVRFLTGSHSDHLATRDNLRARRLIESPWYQTGYGDRFQLMHDQNAKGRYENDHLGFRQSFGVKTGVTGEGGDFLSIDDPHVAIEGMYSKAERENVLDTWDQQIANRVNDPVHAARLLTMQRLHVDDLVGHVLKAGGWEVLVLPQEYQPTTYVTSLGFKDPRTEDGELLWDRRFTSEVVKAERSRLGAHGFGAQHNQKPVPLGGNIVKVEAIFRYTHRPALSQGVYQFWDTAQKDKELNDPWAGGTFEIGSDNRFYILEVIRKRMKYPEGMQTVKDFATKWNPAGIIIEDKSSGSSLIQQLPLEDGFHFSVIPFEPEGDKIMRMATESPAIEAGRVGVYEHGAWVHDFITECGEFPDYETKDQVDMLSMALRWFRDSPMLAVAGVMPIAITQSSTFGFIRPPEGGHAFG